MSAGNRRRRAPYGSAGSFEFGYYSRARESARQTARRKDFRGRGRSYASFGLGCYITSACVRAQGLPDDCFELEALRALRDEYVAALPAGERILAEYYEKAPKVCQAIDALGPELSREVYQDLYERGVVTAVLLYAAGHPQQAFEVYVLMCEELEDRFLSGVKEEAVAL